jgi:hypothetical protein
MHKRLGFVNGCRRLIRRPLTCYYYRTVCMSPVAARTVECFARCSDSCIYTACMLRHRCPSETVKFYFASAEWKPCTVSCVGCWRPTYLLTVVMTLTKSALILIRDRLDAGTAWHRTVHAGFLATPICVVAIPSAQLNPRYVPTARTCTSLI